MNIMEKSKEYANGKAIEALTNVIEQAYKDGYNEGYNDAIANGKDNAPEDLNDGVEYVDLGLPSGTLWSSNYLKKDKDILYLSYVEACKYNIPTKEQFEELVKYCTIIPNANNSGLNYIGPNGKYFILYYCFTYQGDNSSYSRNCRFWIKDEETEELDRSYACSGQLQSFFMGNRIPVMVVKQK
jgi:hypothetical protein